MTDYSLARTTLDHFKDNLPEHKNGIEALERIVELFEPYLGDDPQEARKREATWGTCKNCFYSQPIAFSPADLSSFANTSLRHNVCVRCFGTTILLDKKKRSQK